MWRTAFAVSLMVISAPVQAEAIRQACLESDRGKGQGKVCRCIQKAADQTLSTRDQNIAARLFRDPEEAQKVRRSKRRADEAFWDRYEAFGLTASKYCRRR